MGYLTYTTNTISMVANIYIDSKHWYINESIAHLKLD